MKKKEVYNMIKYYFEDRFYEINEDYYKKLNYDFIKNLESLQLPLIDFYGNGEEKFNSIHYYVLENDININYLYELMEKYKYNFFHTLMWGIYDICNSTYKKTEEYIIQILLKSPYIYSIKKINDYYIIDCFLGKIQFQKASTYFNNINNKLLSEYIKNYNMSSLCHYNSMIVTQNLDDSMVYTGLADQAFVGTFYHSIAFHNGNCIDLNYKVVMPFQSYQKLANFQIIQMLSNKDLKTIDSDEEMFNKALYKQYKKIN